MTAHYNAPAKMVKVGPISLAERTTSSSFAKLLDFFPEAMTIARPLLVLLDRNKLVEVENVVIRSDLQLAVSSSYRNWSQLFSVA